VKSARIFVRVFSLVGALWCAVPAFAAEKQTPSPQTLARDLAATCSACHGTGGNSAGGMPSLAGRDARTLITQMNEFKLGKRPVTVMHQIAKGYDDEQITLIAEYFSKQLH
jgi:cytochrome subunit of sulfide dehydrogenase